MSLLPLTLRLNCWLVGDDASQVFEVKIANTEQVGALRKAIKEEKKPALDHVTADSLALWTPEDSIPVDRHLKERLAGLDLADESQLSSVDDLLDVFPDLPAQKHLHIIVKLLPVGEHPRACLLFISLHTLILCHC
jgi:hypothetical protein